MKILSCAVAASLALCLASAAPLGAKEISERIYLVRAGNVDEKLVSKIKDRIKAALPFSSGVTIDPERQLPREAYDERRGQYDARRVIDVMSDSIRLAVTNERAIIVTGSDLYASGGDFVVSLADAGKGICAMSTYRLTDNGKVSVDRASKEAIRILGVSWKLPECKNPRCVMFAPGSTEADLRKRDTFCYNCRIALERMVAGGTVFGAKMGKK
jgi:predicted Zn-dependent protease